MQLRIYNETPLTPEMYSVVTEIVAEILFVMVLVAMQIHKRKPSKFDFPGLHIHLNLNSLLNNFCRGTILENLKGIFGETNGGKPH